MRLRKDKFLRKLQTNLGHKSTSIKTSLNTYSRKGPVSLHRAIWTNSNVQVIITRMYQTPMKEIIPIITPQIRIVSSIKAINYIKESLQILEVMLIWGTINLSTTSNNLTKKNPIQDKRALKILNQNNNRQLKDPKENSINSSNKRINSNQKEP